MSDFTKTILLRFVRGAVSGAISAMIVILPVGIQTFEQLNQWLISLALAGIVGLISGGLQALDKAYRYESPTTN